MCLLLVFQAVKSSLIIYQSVQHAITNVSASLAYLLVDNIGKTFTLADGRSTQISLGVEEVIAKAVNQEGDCNDYLDGEFNK